MFKQLSNIIRQNKSLQYNLVRFSSRNEPSQKAWEQALPPYYGFNVEKNYPYSDKTIPADDKVQEIVPLTRNQLSDTDILDFWGEGKILLSHLKPQISYGFENCYNLNHQYQVVTEGFQTGYKIPNRIPVKDFDCTGIDKYIADGSFNIITHMRYPITESSAKAISRIIRKDTGLIVLYNPSENEEAMIKVELRKIGFINYQNINWPGEVVKGQISIGNMKAFVPASPLAIRYIDNGQFDQCVDLLAFMYKNGFADQVYEVLKQQSNSDNIFKIGFRLQGTDWGRQVLSRCGFGKSLMDILSMTDNTRFQISTKVTGGIKNNYLICYPRYALTSGQMQFVQPLQAYFDPTESNSQQSVHISEFKLVSQNYGEYFHIQLPIIPSLELCTLQGKDIEMAYFSNEQSIIKNVRIIPQDNGNYFKISLNNGKQNMLASEYTLFKGYDARFKTIGEESKIQISKI
ncbi:hypothetical protein FGO68_gene11432 [Halteria grandinella]|uniref:Uncharacterized protein n=1 Tax=Halteria grandinella TaxID=5974 RepID=A0A8J8NEV6_HALGN|nr:hypothetical protein FGO68_gene11432 [Halteria grandinella]